MNKIEHDKKFIKDFILKYTNPGRYCAPNEADILKFADIVVNNNLYINLGVINKINVEIENEKEGNVRGRFYPARKKVVLNKTIFEDPCDYNLRKMLRTLFHELQHCIQHQMFLIEEDNVYRNKLENSQKFYCGTKNYIPDAVKVYTFLYDEYICKNFGKMGQKKLLKFEKDVRFALYRNLYMERDARICGCEYTKNFFENLLKAEDLTEDFKANIKHNLCYAKKEFNEEKEKNKKEIEFLDKCFNMSCEELFGSLEKKLLKFAAQLKGASSEDFQKSKDAFWAMFTRLAMANEANKLKEYYKYIIKNPLKISACGEEKIVVKKFLGEEYPAFTMFFSSALGYKMKEIDKKERLEISNEILNFALGRSDVCEAQLKNILTDDDMFVFQNRQCNKSKHEINEEENENN